MKKTLVSLFAGLMMFGVAGGASAATIDFSEFAPNSYYGAPFYENGNQPIVSKDLKFTYNDDSPEPYAFGVYKDTYNPSPNLSNTVLSSYGDLFFSEKNGGLFNLNSFDLTRSWYNHFDFKIQGLNNNEVSYEIIDNFSQDDILYGSNWTTAFKSYNLNWENIDTVAIFDIEAPNNSNMTITNINYDAAPVPEPSSMILGAISLAAMGLRKRFRKVEA